MPTPEEKILNQLQGAPRINPASARLFTDWTLEPGDVVTVRSTEGDSVRNYQLPIYSMDFNWNGSPMMEISSSGNPEREPLPELVRKEYAEATSSRGMGRRIADVEEEVQQQYQTWQTKTDKLIGDYAKVTGVKLDAEGNVVYEDEEQTIPVFDPTSPYSLYAKHEVTAQNIVNYVGLTGIQFDTHGNPIYKQAKDAQGNPIYDAQGNPVYETDSQGNLIPDLDAADGHSMYSQISQSIDSIDSVVSGHTGAITRIEQKADRVISEVTAARNGETTLSSRIAQLATEITSKVSQTDLNTTLTGYVTTTAFGTTIGALKDENGNITGASVATLINSQNQGVVKISADMIELDGDIIAGYLEGGTLNVNELDADEIVVGSLSFSTIIDGEAAEVVPSFESLTIGNSPATPKVIDYFSTKSAVTAITYADFPHYHTVSFDNATGQITIGGVTATAPGPFDLTRTTWYQNQISAAEVTGRESVTVSSFTWNQINVSDNPNKPHGKYYSISGQIQLGYQTGVDGQDNPIYTNIGNPIGTLPQEITGVYNTGWENGSDSVTLNDHGWSSTNQRTISTVGRHTEEQSVTVSVSGVWDTQESSGKKKKKAMAVYRILSAPAGTTPTDGNTLFTTSPVMSFQTYTNANHVLTAQLKAGNKLLASVAYDTTGIINYGRSLVSIDPLSTWNGGTLLVQTTGRTDADGTVNQSTRTITLSQGTESLSDAVFTVPVLDGNNTPTGFSVVVDASDLVTDSTKIDVLKGQWVYNASTQESTKITFSPSGGSGSAQELTLTMGERTATWTTTHKKRIDVYDTNPTTGASVRTGVSFEVDASGQYYLGKSTVGLSDTGWDENGSRTIRTSGRTDASGTESNASRTIQISVPSSDFSITSSYDSQSSKVVITATAVAKEGDTTVATGTSADVERAISVSSITLGKSFSRSSAGGQPLSHSGSVSISRSNGGVVSFGTISTVTAEVTSCSVPITLQTPSASFNWDSTNHVYTYTTSASVAVDGTNDALTRSVAGTLTPTDAINHGRTLVSLNDMTWNPITGSSYPASQTISAKTSGRTNTSGVAQEITKTLDVDPYLTYDGTNIYAWIRAGSGHTYISQVSGTISVTGASVTSSQVAYNKTNRTARGQVTGTISGTVNNTTFSKTFTLNNVNFDWAYQDGLDGKAYSERDYEFEDSSTGWSDEYPLNLREVYQKGVEHATPVFEPVARYVWAESNNGAIKFYKNSTGSTRWGTLEANTRVWLMQENAVNGRYYVKFESYNSGSGSFSEYLGYIPTQFVHDAMKSGLLPGGGWKEKPDEETTMYICDSSGNYVTVYSSNSINSSVVGQLYPNTEVTCLSVSNDWAHIRVVSNGYSVKCYVQYSIHLQSTETSPSKYGSARGWVKTPQVITIMGYQIEEIRHSSGIYSSPLNVKMSNIRDNSMREYTSTATQSTTYENIATSGDPGDFLNLVNTSSGLKYYAWHNSTTYSGDVGHKVKITVSYSDNNTETVWISILSKATNNYNYIN